MDWFKLLVIRHLAQRDGVPVDRANRLGVIAAMIPGNLGLVAGVVAVRNEAPPEPTPGTVDGSGTTTTGTNKTPKTTN